MRKEAEEFQIEKNLLIGEIRHEKEIREQATREAKTKNTKIIDLETKIQNLDYAKSLLVNEHEEV